MNKSRKVELRIGTGCGRDDFGYWHTSPFYVAAELSDETAIEAAIEMAWERFAGATFIVFAQIDGDDYVNSGL